MDLQVLQQFAPWLVNFVLGISAVWAIFGKLLPKINLYIKIAHASIDLLEDATKALEDKNLSEAEVKSIISKYEALKELLPKKK